HDETGCRHDAVGSLAARELRAFLDTVDRNLAGAAKDGEHRAIPEEVDCIVPPFAGGNLAAVEAEYAIELAPVESHAGRGGGRRSGRRLAPVKLARFSIAIAHRRLLCETDGS